MVRDDKFRSQKYGMKEGAIGNSCSKFWRREVVAVGRWGEDEGKTRHR